MRLDAHLAPRPANHVPLTPLDLLDRTVEAHPERPAVVWRERTLTYRAFGRMVARFAESGGDLRELVIAIVTSEAFVYRRVQSAEVQR